MKWHGVIRIVRWPLVFVPLVVVVLFAAGAGRGCLYDRIPHFSSDQLQAAVVNAPPLTPKTTLDLAQPAITDKLLAAYQQLSPWGDEQGRVYPEVELRLQLTDGRTIGVAFQTNDPEMLVRVYKGGAKRSEIHVRGALMYEFLKAASQSAVPSALTQVPARALSWDIDTALAYLK